MKLSTSLLQAILVGVTIGATATSCTKDNDLLNALRSQCNEECTESYHSERCEANGPWQCLACGMG